MKRILVTLFLFTSFIGFGQSVSAPDSKTFTPNTAGQDASGFVLSGFGTTETLLASISLINPATNTTFYLNRLDGLTPASGFTLNGNKTRLVVTGTMANINLALANLKLTTGTTLGTVQISVAATVNPVGFYYNGVNGHFYKPITATADRASYTVARSRSLLTTFKGQTGYLVTITSANEESFIQANVPATNIWFAATDEVTDGTWVIDAGPEKGTVMKTSNGPTAGNIVGVYNNWAGGEPNGYNHGEDYAVTKWGGGNQWNDLSNQWANPYVIEYGDWSNPDDATFTEFYTNSVVHSNGDVLRAQFVFDFGNNVDETKFKTKMFTTTDSINFTQTTSNSYVKLSGLGKVDMTNDLDTTKIPGPGNKALTAGGQTEWAIIDVYDVNFGGHRLYIDSREFDGTGVTPSSVNSIQLFDIYDGPITYVQDAGGWRIFRITSNISSKILASGYQAYLRLQNGWYGTKAEFTFTQSQVLKPHHIFFGTDLTTTQLGSLYNDIVTVSDVYLAFRELSDKGILGNESKYLTNGIQFQNADVDHNNVFDERDTYKLLEHLQGKTSLWQNNPVLPYMMKLVPKSTYDGMTKTNWSTYGAYQFNRSRYEVSVTPNIANSYSINVTWKGDVNLSHSATPPTSIVAATNYRSFSTAPTNVSNNINISIVTELINDTVYATLNLDPLSQSVTGTQFKLNYDNDVLNYVKTEFKTVEGIINFGTDKGTYVNLGSLITSGESVLSNKTEYKITFTTKSKITNALGLISISMTDAVNRNGNQLKVTVN